MTFHFTPERHQLLELVLEARVHQLGQTTGAALLIDGERAGPGQTRVLNLALRESVVAPSWPDSGLELGGRYPLTLTEHGHTVLGSFDQRDRGRVPELEGEWRVATGGGAGDGGVLITNGTIVADLSTTDPMSDEVAATPHPRAVAVILDALNKGAR